jgi:hypothetical protein
MGADQRRLELPDTHAIRFEGDAHGPICPGHGGASRPIYEANTDVGTVNEFASALLLAPSESPWGRFSALSHHIPKKRRFPA